MTMYLLSNFINPQTHTERVGWEMFHVLFQFYGSILVVLVIRIS